MALYPNAIQKPLGKNTSPMASFDVLCLHTMVGYLKSTDAYFRTVGTFSHFGIGGNWGSDVAAGLDGVVYQWGDTAKRSAANLDGNPTVISVETADNAPASAADIAAWTPKQQTAIVSLMVWAHKTHNIPLELIPDTKPGRKGIAYHRQGVNPWRVNGGVLWSSSTGKVCPGDRRIAQIPGLISRAKAIVAGVSAEELDVLAFYATKAEYEAAVKKLVAAEVDRVYGAMAQSKFNGVVDPAHKPMSIIGVYEQGQGLNTRLANFVAESSAREAALLAAIQAVATGGVDLVQLKTLIDSAALEAATKAVESIGVTVTVKE